MSAHAIDVERARAETAAYRAGVHHLNHAGASPSPDPVLDVVVGHLRREAEIGGYEAADEAADRLAAVYTSVARLVGAGDRGSEVALVESATRAWDTAFAALVAGLGLGAGDRILTGRAEYVSNAIAMLQVAERTGATIDVVDDDASGQIDVGRLADMVDRRVKLIALTHVPTNGGLVNPAAEVGRVAREAGVTYLLDACQSVGQMVVDVDTIGCDVLTATGRKFLRGPRGTGFVWVRSSVLDRLDPWMPDLAGATWTGPRTYALRDDARRLETWESSVAGRLGLGAAIDHALGVGPEAIEERVTTLAEELRRDLASIRGVHVHDKGARRSAIVTFTVAGHRPEDVVAALRRRRVNTSASAVTSAQWDLPDRGLTELCRASVHYPTDRSDLDALLDAVAELVGPIGGRAGASSDRGDPS